MAYDVTRELLKRYNEGRIDLTDEEAQQLAISASQYGDEFNVESKPISKGAFDFADMATFGLLPDEWRPYSPGQDIHGETGIDQVSSFISSLGGFATGAGVATKGAKMGWNAIKKTFARKKADDIANKIYKGNIMEGPKLLPTGPNVPQLGQGSPISLSGRPQQLPSGPNIPQLGQGSPLGLPGRSFAPTQMNIPFDPRRPIQTGFSGTGYGSTGYGSTGYQMGGMVPPRRPMGTPGMNPGMGAGMNPVIGGGIQPRPMGGMQPSAMPRRRPMGMQEGGMF